MLVNMKAPISIMKYFYRHNEKILHHRFLIKISRIKSKKKKINLFFKLSNVEAPAYVRTARYAPANTFLNKFNQLCKGLGCIIKNNSIK